MRKLFSIILVLAILATNWYIGYKLSHSYIDASLYTLSMLLFSSIGAFIGMFIMRAFK